jgi:hypothetical protein
MTEARTRLTRREILLAGGRMAAGAGALALAGCGAGRALAPVHPAEGRAPALAEPLPLRLNAVFDNPGQGTLPSAFQDPRTLARYDFNYQVVADWRPPTAAIPYAQLPGPQAFPVGSRARAWLDQTAQRIRQRTAEIHAAGLKALYHTEMVLLPTSLLERHRAELLGKGGVIDLEAPLTQELIRVSLAECFERFPELDGLVIRTGEVYLQDLPYHSGSDPITKGPASHLILLSLLREEACVKRGKLIAYRTWAFDGFTTSPSYYLAVADHIAPHPLLAFAIKHTDGDFWRTIPFNPTLGLGPHQQIVEVECAREYEGKGAHPNYIAHGVIEGFSELRGQPPPIGVAGLIGRPQLAGIFTWARGGGWNGPYIANELWCALNTFVLAQFAAAKGSERQLFAQFAGRLGLGARELTLLRELALLSSQGVLHGQYSTIHRLGALAWTRDQYLGGSDLELAEDFNQIIAHGKAERVAAEKLSAAEDWQRIVGLADELARSLAGRSQSDARFIAISARYGALLYTAVAHGWMVMLKGLEGERTGHFDATAMRFHLGRFEGAWSAFERLREVARECATLYEPFSFAEPADPSRELPRSNPATGLRPSLEHYRRLLGRGRLSAQSHTARM